MYIGKIHCIALGKEMVIFPIYNKNIHYNLGKIQKKKEMYRQKSVIFTIGKTLYIRKGWARHKRKSVLYTYIRKYIAIYIGKHLCGAI